MSGLLVLFGLLSGAVGIRDDGHRRSDTFWAALAVEGSWAESYDSLDAMFAQSDVVLLGRMTSIDSGRVFGKPNPVLDHPEEAQFFFASITIDPIRVLRGDPVLDKNGSVVLEELLPERARLDTLAANLPDGRTLFFLRNEGVDAQHQGRSRSIVERDSAFYRRITPQGIFRDIGGSVHTAADGEGGFLLALEGMSFDALVTRLSTTAG